jgi:hypothetical protein
MFTQSILQSLVRSIRKKGGEEDYLKGTLCHFGKLETQKMGNERLPRRMRFVPGDGGEKTGKSVR